MRYSRNSLYVDLSVYIARVLDLNKFYTIFTEISLVFPTFISNAYSLKKNVINVHHSYAFERAFVHRLYIVSNCGHRRQLSGCGMLFIGGNGCCSRRRSVTPGNWMRRRCDAARSERSLTTTAPVSCRVLSGCLWTPDMNYLGKLCSCHSTDIPADVAKVGCDFS